MSYPCDYSNAVSKADMGPANAQLRLRNGYSTSDPSTFDPAASLSFASGFYGDADAWGSAFSADCETWKGSGNPPNPTDPTWGVDWWGHVGVYGHCGSSTFSWHQKGRAFDLCQVRFKNGEFMDANWSWRQGQKQKRRYLGVAAHLRRSFDTVLTFKFPNHADHIHFDNGDALSPIDDTLTSDTLIVQMACNYLNGAALIIDGNWGSATETAFNNLRSALGMNCFNIRTSLSHTKTFLYEVAKRGILDTAATNTGWCA